MMNNFTLSAVGYVLSKYCPVRGGPGRTSSVALPSLPARRVDEVSHHGLRYEIPNEWSHALTEAAMYPIHLRRYSTPNTATFVDITIEETITEPDLVDGSQYSPLPSPRGVFTHTNNKHNTTTFVAVRAERRWCIR